MTRMQRIPLCGIKQALQHRCVASPTAHGTLELRKLFLARKLWHPLHAAHSSQATQHLVASGCHPTPQCIDKCLQGVMKSSSYCDETVFAFLLDHMVNTILTACKVCKVSLTRQL